MSLNLDTNAAHEGAGRELDATVAEVVFGCAVTRDYPATIAGIPVCGCRTGNWHNWKQQVIPPFSGSWEGAGMVIEAMRAKGWEAHMIADAEKVLVSFTRANEEEMFVSTSATFAESACGAALAALASGKQP